MEETEQGNLTCGTNSGWNFWGQIQRPLTIGEKNRALVMMGGTKPQQDQGNEFYVQRARLNTKISEWKVMMGETDTLRK